MAKQSEEMNVALGRRIAQARHDRGLTQMAVAEHLGVHLGVLERYEQGSADPSEHLPALAEMTGRPVSWFLAQSDDNVSVATEETFAPDDELEQFIASLNRRWNEVRRKEALLEARARGLDEREAGFQEQQASVASREAELAKREAEVEAAEHDLTARDVQLQGREHAVHVVEERQQQLDAKLRRFEEITRSYSEATGELAAWASKALKPPKPR